MSSMAPWYAPFERHEGEWIRRLRLPQWRYSLKFMNIVFEIEVPSNDEIQRDWLGHGMTSNPVLVKIAWPTLPPTRRAYRFRTERDAVCWAQRQVMRIASGQAVQKEKAAL